MAIDIACPECQQKYHLKDELAGKKAKCVKCGASIAIPAPVVAAAVAAPLPDLSDLFSDFHPEPAKPTAAIAPSAPAQTLRPAPSNNAKTSCPDCGAAIDKSAVICVKCGYNARTGKKLSTKHESFDAPAKPPRATKVTLLKGAIFSAVGAALGAALWVAIVVFTGFQVGYVAWALGAAAGVGMAIAHDDDDGAFAGIIAAGMSIGGILAAKFFMLQHFKAELGDLALDDVADIKELQGVGQQQLAQLGQLMQENLTFADMFAPIDALFMLLAVGSAYKLGSGKAVD